MTQDILDVAVNVPADLRPTKAQFRTMPFAHRKALVKPLKSDGEPYSIADVSALRAVRAVRAERRKHKKTRKPKVVYGKNHAQKSEGVYRNR